ncbi:malto-oligosyltrehalose synthase [Microbacterium sp. BR1]|uniref:malto-oligosyltrehalose synthase n=1 Tax=Microbacterium sp. BR1 TaxID=1070896 RepID=UPI000C2BB852|nr:malto-oligosyltrehalose synthase [Microbacterium sp. BR1]
MTRRPLSTYRLQIRPSFDLHAAASITRYLRDLGADWAYLSPLLKATEGSDHGYDVVDPSLVDPARGGAEGLDRFVASARDAGLGILVDTVPNHMGVSVPAQNPWWWDLLTHGRGSRYAEAFDVDWEFGGGRVRVPVLGGELGDIIDAGEIRIALAQTQEAPHGTLQYFDNVFPLAPDTVEGNERDDLENPEVVRAIVDRQHYELMFWRREAAELNYRRFFAVTTLAGVRVEIPWVFDEAHAEILRWVGDGLVDGIRVDHPDGLLDPGAYLDRLAEATGGAYVLVEKILEHGETLPSWWRTDGTTGYDALAVIDRVLIDPAGEDALDAIDAAVRADDGLAPQASWDDLIHDTKRTIADTIQGAEVARLVRLLDEPVSGAADAIAELLACFPVYRSYLPAGREALDAAAGLAMSRRPDLAGAFDSIVPQLADASLEVARRFQQTTGPVMAKGVEDTAFYRASRLGSLTEVGADPSEFALDVPGFHAAQATRQASWPHAMTTLSTHDTKRGEDVRARLSVLSELPARWLESLSALRAIASTGHGGFDNLLWQAIVGAWPASRERLHAYAEKAAREAAESTGWWDQDEAFEARMHELVDAAFDNGEASAILESLVAEVAPYGWSNSLSAKLLQLTAPGVPDVYQGSELWEMSLVDPDNRRAVDFAARAEMLARIDSAFEAGELPAVDASGAAKMLVTSRALRTRRYRAELFTRYTPLTVVGSAAQHAIAYDRGGVQAVATRLPVGLEALGGWQDTVLLRPAVPAVDLLTGRRFEGGEVPLADLLATYPVALLANE